MTEDPTKLLYRGVIMKYLYFKLGRPPTEKEIFEESKRCEAISKTHAGAYDLQPERKDEPDESDLIALGYWEKREDI
jgi:hypothetical protein